MLRYGGSLAPVSIANSIVKGKHEHHGLTQASHAGRHEHIALKLALNTTAKLAVVLAIILFFKL